MRVVQAFGMEEWESRRFADGVRSYIRSVRRGYIVRAISSPLMEVMAASGIGVAIWWVGGRILAGEIEPAKFFTFIAAVMLLYQPVKQLGRVGQTAIAGAAAAERIFEILDAPSPVEDTGTVTLAPFQRSIRFEQVGFSYDGERVVLRDFDLEVRSGETVALVGSSGGGKTTVANLLPRFWDPTSGRVTIDGVDLRDATLASLRAQIAVVTQDTVLFDDTIRSNIAYGRPDLPLSEVERAAKLADAHDFICAQPQGYDTVVGERGSRLSGGQKQRIAIARAFLKDAPILILDEATSALDAETEREVQRALDKLVAFERERRRTTLVIAHRLSTIRNADRIVVMSEGRVVEIGLARRARRARGRVRAAAPGLRGRGPRGGGRSPESGMGIGSLKRWLGDVRLRRALRRARASDGEPVRAEGVVFSKDRPLQLFALLSSYAELVRDPPPLHVLYRASDEGYRRAYDEVLGASPAPLGEVISERVFRDDLLALLDRIRAPRLFFLVDDIVFVREVDLAAAPRPRPRALRPVPPHGAAPVALLHARAGAAKPAVPGRRPRAPGPPLLALAGRGARLELPALGRRAPVLHRRAARPRGERPLLRAELVRGRAPAAPAAVPRPPRCLPPRVADPERTLQPGAVGAPEPVRLGRCGDAAPGVAEWPAARPPPPVRHRERERPPGSGARVRLARGRAVPQDGSAR